MFFVLIGIVFWIASLHDRSDYATRRRQGSGEVSPEFEGGTSART
jgi:hypothetical protein